MTTPGGGNPLVAPRHDSTTEYSGVGIAESLADVHHGVTSGSWVEGGLALAGTGLETLGLAIDPLGTLAAYGVGWLMEHVQPLSDALDWLAGDPDAIASFAATWRNVGQAVSGAGEDFAAQVASGTATWTGQAGDGYRAFAQGQIEQISTAGRAAETVAAIVEGAGVLVAVVREIVRDLVAECVATLIVRIPQWLAEEGATLGLATPHVVASAVTLISKWVARIGEMITKLIRSLDNLMPLIRQLDEIFSVLRDGFRSVDRVADPPTPDGEASPPHTSPVSAPNAPDITTGPAPPTSGSPSPTPTAPVSEKPDLPGREATPTGTIPAGASAPTPSRVAPTPDAPTSPTGTQGPTPSISEPAPPGASEPSRITRALEPDTPAAAGTSTDPGRTNLSPDEIPAPLRRDGPLPTKELENQFHGENDPTNPNRAFYPRVVEYMSPARREEHRLFVRDGKLHWASDGSPFDTSTAGTLHSGQGRAIFVMDEHGNMYASNEQSLGKLHHSSFLGGRPVAGAGEIVVEDGLPTLLTRRSGHYRPLEEHQQQVRDMLAEHGVDVDNILFEEGF